MLPIVSILLPVYNAEKYLSLAVDSILNQTFDNFELLLINDGSTDKSVEIMNEYDDSRIRIINNDKNRGIVYSLNSGIEHSEGKYIARMDADDIAIENRLSLQVAYLDSNPEIDILGGNYQFFGEESHTTKLSTNIEEIKLALHFDNQLCHPAIMLRKSSIIKHNLLYNKNFFINQDWVFWFDAVKKNLKVTNLPNVLLKYRLEGQNITVNNKDTEKKRYINVYRHILQHILDNISEQDLKLHWALSKGDVSNIDLSELKQYCKKLRKVLSENGHDILLVDTLLTKKKKVFLYRLADQSFSKAFSFSIANNLISFTTLRYLFSRLLRGK